MAESMLFLARADHAQVALDRLAIDSGSELQRIVDYFEGIAEEAPVRLAVQAHGTVNAEALLFRRAVSNLVSNAIRHTAQGGTIQLTASPVPGATVVAVTNPGLPITSEPIPRLFDRFYRADHMRSDSASSTGLERFSNQ